MSMNNVALTDMTKGKPRSNVKSLKKIIIMENKRAQKAAIPRRWQCQLFKIPKYFVSSPFFFTCV